MSTNVFRKYDIRGIYNKDIDEDFAYKIGKSFAAILIHNNKKNTVVTYDNRSSSKSLFDSLIKGITKSGVNVTTIGLGTSSMHYFAMEYLKITSGIMITASHNPKEYNGFKISLNGIYNICGEEMEKFKNFTLAERFKEGNGTLTEVNIDDNYIETMLSSINLGKNKPKIVVDCGNGTASIIAKKVFDKLGIEYIPIYCESNPNFPNHHPDPSVNENLEDLQKEVIKTKSDIGFSFDGDGDRIGTVDEKGNIIEADELMIIASRDMFRKNEDKRVQFDVKCSKSLEDEIIKLGGTPIQFRTGDAYGRKNIYENNIPLGGELSGHIYFNDKYYGFSDGIYASLRLIEILSNTDKNISELLEGINKYYSTDEIKMEASDEIKFNVIEKIKEYSKEKEYKTSEIDGCKVLFEDGFALVRASNTGPNVTTRFEAKTKQRLEEIKTEFETKLQEIIKES